MQTFHVNFGKSVHSVDIFMQVDSSHPSSNNSRHKQIDTQMFWSLENHFI